jgi:hypothetical protein
MKDPAVLLYIDKWLVSTKNMRADAKGWYLNLILYQYDMGDLPNDIEELANLCDVRFSEFEHFKQVFEQVLKQKFKVNSNNRLENAMGKEILRKREQFKDKRSNAGKLSYVLKYFRANFNYDKGFEEYFKNNVNIDFDVKNKQVLKQVFEQNFKLYINVNKDKDININKYINKEENINKEIDYNINNNYIKDINIFKKEYINSSRLVEIIMNINTLTDKRLTKEDGQKYFEVFCGLNEFELVNKQSDRDALRYFGNFLKLQLANGIIKKEEDPIQQRLKQIAGSC